MNILLKRHFSRGVDFKQQILRTRERGEWREIPDECAPLMGS
jgi:hypothetical protein